MTVLVTGASGYIGSAVVLKLRESGHEVDALARSDVAAARVEAQGARPLRGSLRDLHVLAQAARNAGGVIHIALEWSPEACDIDRGAVETMLSALAGSGKPLLYTSGVWVMGDTGGRIAGELAPLRPPAIVAWRPAIERAVLDAAGNNIRSIVIRPAMVYGRGGGFVGNLLNVARRTGRLRVAGNGENHFSFVHVDDLAVLYVRAMDRSAAGEIYVAADGPPTKVKDLAEAVCRAAGASAPVQYVPLEQARAEMGPIADALVMDQMIGSTKAARQLGWLAGSPSVLQVLAHGYAG